jgi:hypothetical protein
LICWKYKKKGRIVEVRKKERKKALTITSISIQDVNVVVVDINMVKEVGPHEAMIGLWMGLGESHVLVHVEGHHMLETNFTSLYICL